MKLAFCAACGKTDDLHQYYLVPGGGDEEENLITLCGSCYSKLSERMRVARAEQVERANQRAEALRPVMAELAGLSSHAIAAELNRRGVPTPRGGPWHSKTVLRVLNRLKMIQAFAEQNPN